MHTPPPWLPRVAAGLPLATPRPCPVWPPGCPGSDLASLRQPQSQEDFTALWSYRLWLQRKSLTPGRHKLFAFHSRGSVLRFREIRMDCFRARSHGAHCLDSDRYASLEGCTWPSVRGPCLGRDHAAGVCVPWMTGITRRVTLTIKMLLGGPACSPCMEAPGGHCALNSKADRVCTGKRRHRAPILRELTPGPGELSCMCGHGPPQPLPGLTLKLCQDVFFLSMGSMREPSPVASSSFPRGNRS